MANLKKIVAILAVMTFVVVFAPFSQAQDAVNMININVAGAEELVALKQVGAKLAERIVKYREEKGPFKTVEDITNVPGVGQKILQLNKGSMTVE